MIDAVGQAAHAGNGSETGNPTGEDALAMSRAGSRQRVSALADGELERAAADQTIDRLLVDEDLRAIWRDLHRVADSLRSEELITAQDVEPAATRMENRFAALLDAEPTILAPRRREKRLIWARHLVPGVGVSAGVGLIALAVALQFGYLSLGTPLDSGQQFAAARAPARVNVSMVSADGKPVDREKLSEYLSAHQKYTPASWRDPALAPVGLMRREPLPASRGPSVCCANIDAGNE